MLSAAVLWATIGVALILIEVFTNTFFLLFFGASALIVSLLKLLGLSHLPLEIVLFAGLGILGTAVLRRKFRATFTTHAPFRNDAFVDLVEDIAPRATATISYQGSKWTAENDSDVLLARGTRAVIARTEGVKLFLKPKE